MALAGKGEVGAELLTGGGGGACFLVAEGLEESKGKGEARGESVPPGAAGKS